MNDSVIFKLPKKNEKGKKKKKNHNLEDPLGNTARFTLGVRANVQPKSSIPIGAKSWNQPLWVLQ